MASNGTREGKRGNPGHPAGSRKITFQVQANVWEHLKSLVREGAIGGDPNEVAWYLFTQELLRSMRDPALHRVPSEDWQKVAVTDGEEAEPNPANESEEGR